MEDKVKNKRLEVEWFKYLRNYFFQKKMEDEVKNLENWNERCSNTKSHESAEGTWVNTNINLIQL